MMKKNLTLMLVVGLALFYSLTVLGGTLVYEDRSIKDKDPKKRLRRVSKVKIVSISDGVVILEKNGATRRIPLKMLKGYYSTDLQGGGDGDFDDNTAEYTIQISNIDVPKSGYKKSKGKKKRSRKVTKLVIDYRLVKQDKVRKTSRIRRPYVYLYIYTSGANEYHNSNLFKYYFPKQAKIKNKVYNRAEIMSAVASFKRPIINLNDFYNQKYHSGSHRKLTKIGGDRRAEIEMKGIKSRKILAYHLEVWGKQDIIVEKDWHEPGITLGKKWWIR
jgi:hypothetical protein